jgi:hypothetical protein
MRRPRRSLRLFTGESVRTMMTAPDRWPRETILAATPLSTRSITIGASRYAARTLPAMNDSLSSGQPRYLLNSATESARVTSTTLRPSASRDMATLAIGSVRFHITGSPPTGSEQASAARPDGRRMLTPTCSAVTTTTQDATASTTAARLGREWTPQRFRTLTESEGSIACAAARWALTRPML